MSSLPVVVRFLANDAPATGLTKSEINLYLTAVNKTTGAETVIWNGSQHPDTEYTGRGAYGLVYASFDFETYSYLGEARYVGATPTDSDYAYGAIGGDGLAELALVDLDAIQASVNALNNLSAQQVWEYATRTLTAFGFNVSISEAQAQAIADQVLRRSVTNVQDEAERNNLAQIILATFESSIVGTDWVIRKTGGATYETKTVTLDAEAVPVAGVT